MKSDRDRARDREGETTLFFKNVTVLGVGLIGASFALALKKNKLCDKITGHGRNEDNLRKAQEKGIIDAYALDPAEACRDSDLVLFAAPVGSFLDIAKKASSSFKQSAIITDVGSVKGKLVHDMEAAMPGGTFFIGGHPIAGSDRSGIDTASAEIFQGARCMLTPTRLTDPEAFRKVSALWTAFGSEIMILNPDEHDRIYAAVSHLPHLIAYEILNTVAAIDSSYLAFSGQGFRDTTRIASSHPALWRDICMLNRENLLAYVEIFKNSLDRVSEYLRAYDSESLEKDFKKARTLREGIGQN
jgi:prephenate dehydrogenase